MSGGLKKYSSRRFRSALHYFVVGRAAQAVANIAFLLLVVRVLSPTEYGQYMVIWGSIEFLRSISSLGILPAVQQFLPEMAIRAHQLQLRGFVRWVTAIRFGLLGFSAAVLLIFWKSVGEWLSLPPTGYGLGIVVCAMIVTVLGASFTEGMLEALLEQRSAQLVRALFPIIRLVGLAALVGANVVTLDFILWIDLLGSAICLVLAEILLLRQLRSLTPDGTVVFHRKQFVEFALNMSLARLLNSVTTAGALRVVASKVMGIEAAGQFGFLQQLLAQVNKLLPSLLLAGMIRPMLIARHVHGDSRGVAESIGFLWKLNIMMIWPIGALMFIAGDATVALLSGDRVVAGGAAMGWMLLAAASTAQNQLVTMVLQIHRLTNVVRSISWTSVAAPVFMWIGSSYGLVGAAIAIALALWFRGSISLYLLGRERLSIEMDWAGAVRVSAGIFAAGLVAVVSQRWLMEIYTVVPFVLLFAASLWFLKPFSLSEFSLMQRVFGKRVQIIRGFVRG